MKFDRDRTTKIIDGIRREEYPYNQLREIVKQAWETYFTGVPIMSDEYYDTIVREILAVEQYSPIMKEFIGTEPVGVREGHTIKKHSFPQLRGTLNNVHKVRKNEETSSKTHKSMEEWVSSIPRKVKLHASLKVDGISSVIELEPHEKIHTALKRGDTSRNLAQTIPILEDYKQKSMYEVFSFMHDSLVGETYDVPTRLRGLKVEVYMTTSMFETVQEELDVDNPLSATSSLVNKLKPNPDHLEYLSIFPISAMFKGDDTIYIKEGVTDIRDIELDKFVEKWNPSNNLYVYSDDFGGMDRIVRYYRHISNKYNIPADGVVFTIIDEDVRQSMGREDNINQYEVAFKFPLEIVEARINHIDMSVGSYGNITPVVKIDPVYTGGVSVKSITVGSISRLKELQLGIGDIVGVSRGVVPFLHHVISRGPNGPDTIPEECPVCKRILSETDSGELKCDSIYCPARVVGIIDSHCKRMDIAGVSERTIDTLIEKEVLSDILSLYFMEQHEYRMRLIPGFGEVSVAKILNTIKEASLKPVKDYVLFGALGIPDMGERKFRNILKSVHANNLIGNYENIPTMLDGLEGCGGKTIHVIHGWFSNENNRRIAKGLLSVYVNTEYTTGVESETKMTAVFTGFRNKEAVSKLSEVGIEVIKSYRKTVDLVVIPSKGFTSSTVEKAIKDGKKIVPIDKLLENLNIEPTM